MAGAFDREVLPTEPLYEEALATYISNLQFAAEQSKKVYKNVATLFLHLTFTL